MIMAMKIIVDTSVLISLAKIGRLEILARKTDNLTIPEAVYEEAVVEGEKKDIPDATIIKMFIAGHNIPVAKVQRDFKIAKRRFCCAGVGNARVCKRDNDG